MDYPVFNMELIEGEGKGLYCISLVDVPAIQSDFILLSKELRLVMANDEKREIMGAVLIPNIPIFRKGTDGQPFYAQFSEETVKRSAIDFINRNDKSISVMHNGKAIECKVVESLILKEDSDVIDAPKGSWVVTLKVEDSDAWDAVKSGMLKGFSLEGVYKKADLIKLEINMEDSQKLDKILELLQVLVDTLTKAAEAAPAEAETETVAEMRKQNETLALQVEALKAEVTKLEESKLESVKMKAQEVAADGFSALMSNLNKNQLKY